VQSFAPNRTGPSRSHGRSRVAVVGAEKEGGPTGHVRAAALRARTPVNYYLTGVLTRRGQAINIRVVLYSNRGLVRGGSLPRRLFRRSAERERKTKKKGRRTRRKSCDSRLRRLEITLS